MSKEFKANNRADSSSIKRADIPKHCSKCIYFDRSIYNMQAIGESELILIHSNNCHYKLVNTVDGHSVHISKTHLMLCKINGWKRTFSS